MRELTTGLMLGKAVGGRLRLDQEKARQASPHPANYPCQQPYNQALRVMVVQRMVREELEVWRT